MRGMRNIVIHQYFHVDLIVLWTTATDDLPKLKRQIDQLFAAPPRGAREPAVADDIRNQNRRELPGLAR
jgi:hypothetical protein